MTLALALLLAPGARAQPPEHTGRSPLLLSLPSERPSGSLINDRIWFHLYRPGDRSARMPAVVILHSLAEGAGGFIDRRVHGLARYLADHGILSAVMTLPYHKRRLLRGVDPLRLYTAGDERAALAVRQAAADASTLASWLAAEPGVDSGRIGVVGVSLGAIIAHLAMGLDSRLSAGVAVLGGGNLEDLQRGSVLPRLFHPHGRPVGAALRLLREADPLQYASQNRPRRVLMVEAARDLIIPPHNAVQLWEALGRPPIQWVDTNHFGLLLGDRTVARAALAYLRSVWSGGPPQKLPAASAPTLKLGLVMGLSSFPVPAALWQVASLGRRPDRTSLLHLDLGISVRGWIGAAGFTLNPSLDAGLARRLDRGRLKPYASLHLVF